MQSPFESIEEFSYDHHLILYHKVSKRLYALNSTGQLIWKFYKKGLDERSIADRLAEEYSIAGDVAFKDVETCISVWKQAGVLDTVDIAPDRSSNRQIFCEFGQHDYSLSQDTQWHSHHFFKLAGRTIRGAFGDPDLETVLLPILAHLEVEDDDLPVQSFSIWQEKGDYFVALRNGVIHSTDSLPQAVGWILFDLADQAYRSLDCMAVLHGGAVRHGNAALILAGRKGSGKSTLIAALQHDGFGFLCDDICPLEKKRGLLVPVPMSLRLKAGSWTVLEHIYPFLKDLTVHNLPDCNVKYLAPLTGDQTTWASFWPVEKLIFPIFHPHAATDIVPAAPVDALQFLIDSGGVGCGCPRSFLAWLEKTPSFVMRYADMAEAKRCIATITTGMKLNGVLKN